jgi:hypothetical protein
MEAGFKKGLRPVQRREGQENPVFHTFRYSRGGTET